jgi:hypothetical protein
VRAAEYRNELESTVFGNPEGGELATIDDRADAAFSALLGDRTDRNKFMQLIVFAIKQIDIILPRGLFLWSLLPLFISLIGLLLIVLIAPIVGELALVVCLLGLLIGLLFFAQRR